MGAPKQAMQHMVRLAFVGAPIGFAAAPSQCKSEGPPAS
jgi:hypothetical protein